MSDDPGPHSDTPAYLFMLGGCASFTLMGALAQVIARHDLFPWQGVAMTRAALACVFALVLARVAGAQLVFFRPPVLWLRSVAGSFSMVLTFYAFAHLPLADTLTLTNTFPLWVALLSWPLLGEVPGRGVWLAVLCGLAGVALVQRPHLAEGNLAVFAALGAAVCTAFAMMGLHKLRGLDTRAVVAHFSAVSTLFCGLAWLAGGLSGGAAVPPRVGWLTAALILGVGVAATVGQLFLTRAFTAGAPARVSVVGLTQVVFGAAVDALAFGHHFDPLSWLGVALVVAPTAWLLLGGGGKPEPQPAVPPCDAPLSVPPSDVAPAGRAC